MIDATAISVELEEDAQGVRRVTVAPDQQAHLERMIDVGFIKPVDLREEEREEG